MTQSNGTPDNGAGSFSPYIPASESPKEFSVGALVLGVLLGLVFAASSIYLALKVSLTVSASIPIAVLSITIFRYISRAFRKAPATILQNNLVQTTGSAGESIAAGIAFTLPALLLLGYELPWIKVMAIGIVGGILGVLFLVPIRRSLIVKEHANLKYPEGTACAQVLIVGEKGGMQAKTVFMGFGLGAAYKLLNGGFHAFLEVPKHAFTKVMANGQTQLFGEIQAEISPELTGVGYIIGPRIAGYLFAGGLLSFFCLIPAIKLFGAGLTEPIFPATALIKDMNAMDVRSKYVYYIGAGAVTMAGIISLARTLPTIWSSLIAGLGDFRGSKSGDNVARTDRDLPMGVVIIGALVCLAAMVLLPQIGINIAGGIIALFFAFLFVTVSSRITGQIGSSANPVSGMTVATLLLTSLMFLAAGWVGIEYRVLALSIGGVVCVAASTAGATSQDLKTGFLVGATPRYQQIGLLIGVTASALLVGGIIQFLNDAKTTIVAKDFPGVQVSTIEQGARFALSNGRLVPASEAGGSPSYRVGRLFEATGPAIAGKYLVDDAGAIKYVVDPGVGGHEPTNYDGRTVEKLDSPKAQIMALVVDGILTQKLPWGLILIGAFLAIGIEVLGIPSLPVAVGVYLPISTSGAMFMGGLIRWLVDRRLTATERDSADADSGPGVLFSSGLIAGGAIMGVVLAGLAARHYDEKFDLSKTLGSISTNNIVSIVAYVVLLAIPLFLIARRPRSAGV
ncbi:MAG: oligopeptide transporter, OPT family [bacterium]